MKTVLMLSAACAALSLQACSDPAEKATEPASAPTAAATAKPLVTLTDSAITIGGATPASFAIGAPKAQVLAAFTTALGGAPTDAGPFQDCGAGPMDHAAWNNGLDLLFQDDKLAGWQTQTPDISTDKGVHVGSTLAELQAAYPNVQIEQNTIGWSFASGALMGYLDDNKALVQRINVGVTCDFT